MPPRFSLLTFPDGIRLLSREDSGVVRSTHLSAQQGQQQSPIVVRIVETPRDPTGLADVMIGALGLTGALVVLALVVGALVGGVMFFARSRHPLS